MKILFLTISLFLFADFIVAQEINKKYSFKDFTGMNSGDFPASEFNGTVIKGSSFYQESDYSDKGLDANPPDPSKSIFPVDMENVIFDRCNLDNVIIPQGNMILPTCTNKKIRVQNDWDDWILGNDNKPVEPMNKERRIESNLSFDPKNIPKKKWTIEEKENFNNLISAGNP